MAYDYSTGTMYIINMLGVLYEVDLETGDLDLDSAGCWMASYRVLPPVPATTPVALPLTWTETPTL